MKILRITAQGLPLFKKDLDICFYTQQRVCEEDKDSLYRLTDNHYLHSACAFILHFQSVDMPPSEAEKHGYERASKHPKSTKYGRQNPIAERWNSEERIDHRSHADRGLTEQPTIHEGVAARALEKKGIVSDRCEINRQIKADNALLRELRAVE